MFASPFFEAALSGAWLETNPTKRTGAKRKSISSVITISQPPVNPGDRSSLDVPPEMTFAPVEAEDTLSESDFGLPDDDIHCDADAASTSQPSSPRPGDADPAESIRKEKERQESLNQLLQGTSLSSRPSKLKKKGVVELATLKERKSKESTDNEPSTSSTPRSIKPIAQAKVVKPKEDVSNGPEAVVLLKEEKAHVFHDFLRFAYPQ